MQLKGAKKIASIGLVGKASQRRGPLRWSLNKRIRVARDGSLSEGGKLERSPPREESGACSREAGRGNGRSPWGEVWLSHSQLDCLVTSVSVRLRRGKGEVVSGGGEKL